MSRNRKNWRTDSSTCWSRGIWSPSKESWQKRCRIIRCPPDKLGSQAPKRELYQVVPRYLTLCPTWVPGHLHGLSVKARERTSESIGLAQSTEMSAQEAICVILNLSRLCALLQFWVLSCVLSALILPMVVPDLREAVLSVEGSVSSCHFIFLQEYHL